MQSVNVWVEEREREGGKLFRKRDFFSLARCFWTVGVFHERGNGREARVGFIFRRD